MKKLITSILSLSLALCLLFSGCVLVEFNDYADPGALSPPTSADTSHSVAYFVDISENLPEYTGEPYAVLNGNTPDFTEDQLVTTSYEYYSELDYLGRCGYTVACIGLDLMPTEDRGNISHVKPTGWHSVQYDNVDGKSLYNRCHLIGFQLSGENANVCNLITGTRYMNVDGMLPFENMVADYVKETKNHVIYRVTPIFVGTELVARGVTMEALSVEDGGEGICFNVFVFNVQPGIEIDYQSGESNLSKTAATEPGVEADFVLNTNSMKFHLPSCGSVSDMNQANREDFSGTRQELIDAGYSPCGSCKP